jgi:putative Mg2+ transporter-C (MgtC) family protein
LALRRAGGIFVGAVSATVLVLLVLAGFKPLENRLFVHRRLRALTLTVERQAVSLMSVEEAVAAAGLRLERVVVQPGTSSEEDRFDLVIGRVQVQGLDALIDWLRTLPGVRTISSVRVDEHLVPTAMEPSLTDPDEDPGSR